MSKLNLMKTLTALLIGVALISFATNEPVPRHNVYFPWNSSEPNGSAARVVESVYLKIAAGNQVRFGIKGPISNVHNTAEKNRITTERANSIVKLIDKLRSEEDKVEVVNASPLYGPSNSDRAMAMPIDLEVLVTKAQGWVEPSFTSIDEYLPMEVQHFTINPREDNRLVGNQGTVINIPAFCLELRNGSVPSEMNVELTEVYGNGQIVNADLHTNSNGRMLETGGTINLTANANGSAAQVANEQKIDLEFPFPFGEEEPAADMLVFNGRADRAGNFDWVEPNASINLESSVRETFYINDVVSLNIVFQCKRYKETVSPHHVRDFRGAMQGRGEKGLIMSTGRFTKEAQNEANRDGVTPIELIDGERLVDLFEKHRLGLKPVMVFEIDHEFFKNFN